MRIALASTHSCATPPARPKPTRNPQQLHARLALLPVDGAQVDYLATRLLNALPPEVPVIRDALDPHQAVLRDRPLGSRNSARPTQSSTAAGCCGGFGEVRSQ